MTTPMSPEREQQIRAEILARLSSAGAFCGECGFQPGETGCADCVRVRELYADAVMPVIDRVRAELAQARGNALSEAAEVAVRAARSCGDSESGQYAASVAAGIGKELRRLAVVPAVGEATR